jgi:hypothetical protein
MMDSPDKKPLSERDICTKFITPAIEQAGTGSYPASQGNWHLIQNQIIHS